MADKKKKVVIIGGGPCGLGAAWRIEEIRRQGNDNVDWVLIEQNEKCGGLASTVTDEQGFLWDMGGHVIFSHYAYFTRLLDYLLPPEEWNLKIREAWVWMRQTFIPYPLQQNLHRLPKTDIIQSIDGLIDNEKKRSLFTKPKTFKDWLIQSFGSGLCEVFMYPYNFKVWAYTSDKMNIEWMGERVATVDLSKVIKNVINQQDELGWGPNNTFRFPLHGGTGAIWKSLYEFLKPTNKFKLSTKVIAIDVKQKLITYSDKTTESYDSIISTMPLDCLCKIIDGTSIPRETLNENAKQFRYSSSHIIGFGIAGQPPTNLQSKCWLYFPEDDCPFYRATVFSNYSPFHVPKPGQQWSLMCEVAESADKPVDKDKIIQIAEQGLINTKLINDTHEIISRYHIRLEYGYPTPFYGRDALCEPLFNEFESHDIYSRGRFGCWKYEVSNQDHSLMLGVEAVDKIVFGTEEMTFKYPGIVNANKDSVGRVPCFPDKK